jgi:hypothetical protein
MVVCIITFHLLLPFHAYLPTVYVIVQQFADIGMQDSDEGDEPKREYTAAGLALKEK